MRSRSRLTGYEVMLTGDGQLVQSGVRSRPANAHQDLGNTQGWITRAVVLAVYHPDQETRAGLQEGQKHILLDVRTYGRYQRFLARVPLLQRTHGLFDQDLYVPRPSRQNLAGGDAVSQPSGAKPPTAADQLDGDHVLVGFLDNDPNQPFCLPFGVPHPNARYRPEQAGGRVRRVRHAGTLMEWDQQGNLTIDARGAAQEVLGPGGTEVSASGAGGQLKWITKDGAGRLTSIHLDEQGRILLGSDPADPSSEPFTLGAVLKAWQERVIDLIMAHTHGTGTGPSSPPLNAGAFGAERGRIAEHLSEFIFGRRTY